MSSQESLEVKEKETTVRRQGRSGIWHAVIAERDHGPKNLGPFDAKTGKILPELPEGTQPRQHLGVSPVRLLFRFLISRSEDKKLAGGILLELQ